MDNRDKKEFEYGTPYDDIWRTIVDRVPHLLVPLINEVFHENYSEQEPITALQNEHMDSAAEKVVSDSYLQIGQKYYHIECQSRPDGTMAIRMIEYDFMIALKHAKKDGAEYTVSYPRSCVLYLRHRESTPDYVTVHMNFPDGSTADYRTPVIKVQKYNLEEIFLKRLLCLLPYYIMRYESSLHDINKDSEKLERLIGEYQQIYSHLLDLERQGRLSWYDVAELKTLTEKLVNYIARKEENIRKGVVSMGGRVLLFPHDIAYDEGRIQGKQDMKKESAFEMFKDGMPCEKVAKYIHESLDRVLELEKEWKTGSNHRGGNSAKSVSG